MSVVTVGGRRVNISGEHVPSEALLMIDYCLLVMRAVPTKLTISLNSSRRVRRRWGTYVWQNATKFFAQRSHVIIYCGHRSVPEILETIAHEMGHAEHHALGEISQVKRAAREAYAEARAAQWFREYNELVPAEPVKVAAYNG